MARLLLGSAPMKVLWALLPLVASSGCLFLDTLNHAPSVSISDGITSTNKGAMLAVHVVADDPEDGPRGVTLTYRIDAVDGQTLDPVCDYEDAAIGPDYRVTFFRTGIFAITVVASDREHATASASVMVTITDAPPAFDAAAAITQTSSTNACRLNAAGDTVTLGLTGGSVGDLDAAVHASAAGCMPTETLRYTWRITDSPGGSKPVLTGFNGLGCVAPTADSGRSLAVSSPSVQVCLWTDPMLVGATGMYHVVLDVSDGSAMVESPVGSVAVAPDAPPCITGTNPVAGSYVVDRTQLQRFEVDGAVDDRDLFGSGIGFVWSVYRYADGTWRDVPSWSLSSYQLDVSSFGVGERLRVRVEALDRTGTRVPASTCALDVAACVIPTCLPSVNVCDKWKTWDLELR